MPAETSPAEGVLWPEGRASSRQCWLPSLGLQLSDAMLDALKQNYSDAKAAVQEEEQCAETLVGQLAAGLAGRVRHSTSNTRI